MRVTKSEQDETPVVQDFAFGTEPAGQHVGMKLQLGDGTAPEFALPMSDVDRFISDLLSSAQEAAALQKPPGVPLPIHSLPVHALSVRRTPSSSASGHDLLVLDLGPLRLGFLVPADRDAGTQTTQ
jgi:hypothetical protein